MAEMQRLPSAAEFDAVCRKHHVARLRLFGSTATGDATPESDVDVLVDFEQGFKADLSTYEGLEEEIGRIFGRPRVDLVRSDLLHWYIRRSVVQSARTLYER
jgi:predicted nucleotidyltransferase